MPKIKKLFLLDALALLYRAHFALHTHTRTNSKGVHTGAVLGFANTLLDVINKHAPTHVVAAFDTKTPTWRKELYPPYKAQRQVQPEAITAGIPHSQRLLKAFGIPVVSLDGYEADDIIGTLTQQALKEHFHVYIVSSDKDLGQLVQANVWLYKPSSGKRPAVLWDKEAVLAHWNIRDVHQIPDILGLSGDSSDNIPGVPNIGPKTAQKLIANHEAIEKIPSKTLPLRLQKLLKAYHAQALLSKKLATIKTDLPLNFDLHTSRYEGWKKSLLKPLLEELEFRSLATRLFPPPTPKQLGLFSTTSYPPPTTFEKESLASYDPNKVAYTCLTNARSIKQLVEKIAAQKCFCFDTETTSLNPFSADLLGIALAYQPHEAFFIPLKNKEQRTFLRLLRPIFSNKQLCKVGQNLKYDLLVLQQHACKVEGPFFDTMIAHHLLEPDVRHNLTLLANQYLRYAPIEIETLIGKGKNQLSLADVPLQQLVAYACEDADITWQIYAQLAPLLRQGKFDDLFYNLEMKLLPVLVTMEQKGIAIDTAVLEKIGTLLEAKMARVEEVIYTLAGTTFNLASPKQLGHVLFDQLKIDDKPAKTPSGQYATNEGILTQLTKRHPIVAEVLHHRTIKKLKSTYVDVLPTFLEKDRRIHTSFQQGFVATGRLSSKNPNVQNMPLRTEQGRTIRKAFVPGHEDNLLMSADYSQIELRIMALFSQDASMLEAFAAKKDIHTMTATQIFNVAEEAVTKDMRQKAKMVNFGIIYGISAFGLAQRLKIPRHEAGDIITSYFENFPQVKKYMNQIIEKAREQGFVRTFLGRKRFLPDINAKNATMRGFAERNAINMPIQGTAAELIQHAMIAIDSWLKKTKLQAHMLLQVHDELVFEVHKTAVQQMEHHIPKLMGEALSLQVPIEVHVGTGRNWLEAHS